MKPETLHAPLIVLGCFAAITAIGGGVALVVTNGLSMPVDALQPPFTNYVLPGIILGGFVGGSALLATVLLLLRHPWSVLTAFGAGAIMAGWIVGEYLFFEQRIWLQPFMLAIGLLMMGLAAVQESVLYRQSHTLVPHRS